MPEYAFEVAVQRMIIHLVPMSRAPIVLSSLICLVACSPADRPGPMKTPPENNATPPTSTEGNRTETPSTQPATGLADFLPGKQIALKIGNDAFKLAPRFDANGTWTNALDPKQHGLYSVEPDGRVILNLPDKSQLTLFIDGDSAKAGDTVDVLVDDTLIMSTVKEVKGD